MSKAETDLSFVDRLVEDQIVCWLRLHNNANINYYMYISNMHSTYNSLALDVLLVIFHHSQRFFSLCLCLWSRVSLIECFYYNLLIKGPLSYKSYKVVESFKNLENWQKSLLHSLCNNVICSLYIFLCLFRIYDACSLYSMKLLSLFIFYFLWMSQCSLNGTKNVQLPNVYTKCVYAWANHRIYIPERSENER